MRAERWIFTVDEVRIRCAYSFGPGLGRITVVANGQEYALNGTARDLYPGMEPIWAPNPSIPGLRMPITDEIEIGRALCR